MILFTCRSRHPSPTRSATLIRWMGLSNSNHFIYSSNWYLFTLDRIPESILPYCFIWIVTSHQPTLIHSINFKPTFLSTYIDLSCIKIHSILMPALSTLPKSTNDRDFCSPISSLIKYDNTIVFSGIENLYKHSMHRHVCQLQHQASRHHPTKSNVTMISPD